ncbi:uncharacterized protein A1O9_07822 [Exophiala aquamarina CBS 119918]|uniref:RRM domain-containing protein n=1 Tax=Exophiala aquamarina CBS 119918 TaxID=1182545 RepID=A0A072P8R3_9EURO|nr:uncharacterized protein A1O9_07822 [Exophiala aquamarina CBS 119918]KEF56241.1 hypothetical protein A1O9_07822 [Exophiala aquamarina CBS 119918]
MARTKQNDTDDPAHMARFLAIINGEPEERIIGPSSAYNVQCQDSTAPGNVTLADTAVNLSDLGPSSIPQSESVAAMSTPPVSTPDMIGKALGEIINGDEGQSHREQNPETAMASSVQKDYDAQITGNHGEGHRAWTSTQKALLARQAEMAKNTKGWMDNVVASFRKANQGELVQGKCANTVGMALTTEDQASHSQSPETEAFPTFDESVQPNALGGVQLVNDTSSSQADRENSSVDGNASDGESPSPERPHSRQEDHSTGVKVPSEPSKIVQSPTIVVTTSTDTEESDVGPDSQSEGDRQHPAHFKSWGTPAARNQPRSHIRTVLLVGLPGTADLTLVQSLIHGGTIETMRLLPGDTETGTTTAYVTFTSPEAFKQYYSKYPNGFELRHKGKKYNVLVDKQKRVDVMSSAMNAYLECGATRVLKVSGAEDDWGVVALHKIATGKSNTRQIEAITDTYSNLRQVRTIFFRFTNIPDAVKFKAHLVRDVDWESCRFEFVEDPCAKASGFHCGRV